MIIEIQAERDIRDAEEEFLRDAEQTAPYGHNQQKQTTEHVDGKI